MYEPEEYSALLDALRTKFTAIIDDRNGTLLRIDGDGLLIAFGHPIMFENATQHAIHTALEIHAAVEAFNREKNGFDIPIQFHTSVHAGVVLVRDGDAARGAYEILGRPTNEAARICDAAAPNEILISDSTLGADRNTFEVSDLIPVKLKNQTDPIPVRRILSIPEESQSAPNGKERSRYFATPFVGRDYEMNWLWTMVESETGVAMIQSEAGMGKSRLLHMFEQQSNQSGYATLSVVCSPEPSTSVLHPIKQLLSIALPTALPVDHDLAGEIDAVLSQDAISTSDSNIDRLSTLLGEALNTLSSREGRIIIIDDWQWADNASRAVIEKLVLSAASHTTFVFGARTVDELFADRVNAAVITLPPLSDSSIEQAAQYLSPDINPFVLKQVQSLSGGNPLFVEELFYAVKRDGGKITRSDQNVWLRSLISDRYAKLTPALAEALRVAAVIGNVVPIWILKSVLESDFSQSMITGLQDADFLFPERGGNDLRFKHGLTRDAIYEVVSLQERRRIHGAIANVLALQGGQADSISHNGQLAYHYGASKQYQLSIRHSVIAGEAALHTSSLDAAQQHFKSAFEQIEKANEFDKRASDIIHQYGLACIVDPSWEQVDVLQNAVLWTTRFQDNEGLAGSSYWLASLYYGLGEPIRALRYLENAKQLASKLIDARLHTQIEASSGQFLAAAADYEQGYTQLATAISTKLKNRSGHRASPALAYAVSCRAFALADQGAFADAEMSFEEALSYLNETRHQTAMSIIGHRSAAALWQGAYDKTLEYSAQVLEMAEQMRSRYHYAMSKALMAAASFYSTGNPDHLSQIEVASNWMTSGGSQQYISLNYGYLVDGYAKLQDWPRVRSYAARALMRARKGDRLGESVAYRGLAIAAQNGHARASAAEYFDKAIDAAHKRSSTRELALSEAARLGLAQGAPA